MSDRPHRHALIRASGDEGYEMPRPEEAFPFMHHGAMILPCGALNITKLDLERRAPGTTKATPFKLTALILQSGHMGLACPMTPTMLRDIAGRMTILADELDAEARAEATAALQRAASRGTGK